MKSKEQKLLEEAYNKITSNNVTKLNEAHESGPLKPNEMHAAMQFVDAYGTEVKKSGKSIPYVRCADGRTFQLSKDAFEKPDEFGDRGFKNDLLNYLVDPDKFRKHAKAFCAQQGIEWGGSESSASAGSDDYLSRHYYQGEADDDLHVAGKNTFAQHPTGKLRNLKKNER